MKQSGILLFCLILNSGSYGQINNLKANKRSFGLHAGGTTGVGLSYRYWPSRFGIQVTTMPFFSLRGPAFILSSGLTGLFNFRKGKVIDFYGYLGNHVVTVISRKKEYTYYLNKPSEATVETVYKIRYNIGLGIGLRCHITEKIDLDLQGGYGIFDLTKYPLESPTIEVGLYRRLGVN